MAVTDLAAIAFVNNEARPAADAMAQQYWTNKKMVSNWFALGMSSKIPNDSTVILDGAATDGRNVVTGQQITAIITQAISEIAAYEATSSAVLNQVLGVAVNIQSKF